MNTAVREHLKTRKVCAGCARPGTVVLTAANLAPTHNGRGVLVKPRVQNENEMKMSPSLAVVKQRNIVDKTS